LKIACYYRIKDEKQKEKPMETSVHPDSLDSISDAQRRCLSHILRNCEQALNGALTMIENKSAVFSADDITRSLQTAYQQLGNVVNATKEGSFCAVPAAQCEFVSPFVGCSGRR